MKKKIILLFLGFTMLSFFLTGCGGKYSDVKKVNEKYISLMDNYITDIKKADNAEDAAKAINKFADGMEKLWPEMQALAKKYPELKDKSVQPEELKELEKKVSDMSKKMVGAMMKLVPYMMNHKVMEAQKRLGSVMAKNDLK